MHKYIAKAHSNSIGGDCEKVYNIDPWSSAIRWRMSAGFVIRADPLHRIPSALPWRRLIRSCRRISRIWTGPTRWRASQVASSPSLQSHPLNLIVKWWKCLTVDNYIFGKALFNMGHTRPLFCLFSSCSQSHPLNLTQKNGDIFLNHALPVFVNSGNTTNQKISKDWYCISNRSG